MADGAARGRPRNPLDMIVTAIAEANDCVVVTDNERDFAGVKKLISQKAVVTQDSQTSATQLSYRCCDAVARGWDSGLLLSVPVQTWEQAPRAQHVATVFVAKTIEHHRLFVGDAGQIRRRDRANLQ